VLVIAALSSPKRRRWLVAGLAAALLAGLGRRVIGPVYAATGTAAASGLAATTPPGTVAPTTVEVIAQGYECIFDHYVDGSDLDDRRLLTGAFAGLTQELSRRGLDRTAATLPAFTGDRHRDWAAFSSVYQRLIGQLPNEPALRQALAAATMNGMVGSLHDDHVGWTYPVLPPGWQPGETYGFGFLTSPFVGLAISAPQEALPPLYVTTVVGGPASASGLRPGDIIETVDGAPPFVAGVPTTGAMNLLAQQYPSHQPVRLTLHRPATGRTWTVTMTPALFPLGPAATTAVTSTLFPGGIADVRLTGFTPGAAGQVGQAIHRLAAESRLQGLILDVRGNGGGDPTEVARLTGEIVHDRTWSYDCDTADRCTPNRTDDTQPLLGLPLVVLTDRDCASACDAFTGAVRDLRLGRLVGTRTAGSVSGIATDYVLADNSLLRLPATHQKGADGETIDGIGVAPDDDLPLTAADLSSGHDPDIDQALALLRRRP
jgi:carboxyl-terminal processing protease